MIEKMQYVNHDKDSLGSGRYHPKWVTANDLGEMEQYDLKAVEKSLTQYPDNKLKSTFGTRIIASAFLSGALISVPISIIEDDLGNNNLRDYNIYNAYVLQTRGNKDAPSILHSYIDSGEFTVLDCNYVSDEKGHLCKILSPEEATLAKDKEEQNLGIIKTKLLGDIDSDCSLKFSRDINDLFCHNDHQRITIPEELSIRTFSKRFKSSGDKAASYATFEDSIYGFDLKNRFENIKKLDKPVELDSALLPEAKGEPSEFQKYMSPRSYPFSNKSLGLSMPFALLTGFLTFAFGVGVRGHAKNEVNEFLERTNFNDRLEDSSGNQPS